MVRFLSLAVLLMVGVTARAGDHGEGPANYRASPASYRAGAADYTDGLRQQVERLQEEVDALKQSSSVGATSTGVANMAKVPLLYDANGNVIGPIMSSWFGSGYSFFLPVPYQLANGKVIQLSATTSALTVLPQTLIYPTSDCSGPAYVQAYAPGVGGWLIEPALASQLPDGTYVYGNGVSETITVEATLTPGSSCKAEAQPSSRTAQAVVPFDPGLDQFTPPFSIRIP
jgi:hypothetical protein